MGFSGGAQTRYKKYPCKAPCKRNSYETICENIVSRYQTLVFSLPRMTVLWHRRPKTHFMTGLAGQPSKYRVKQVSESSYPANFIEKTDEFINLPTGFGNLSSFAACLRHSARNYWTYCCCCFVPGWSYGLMKDQATKLEHIGIPAVTLSDISEQNMRVVERGAFSVVYGSPEAWLKIDRRRKC